MVDKYSQIIGIKESRREMNMPKRHSSLLVGLGFLFLSLVASAADLKPVKTDSYSKLLSKTIQKCLTDLKSAQTLSQSEKLQQASQMLIRSSELTFALGQDAELTKAFNDDTVTQAQFEDAADKYLVGLEANFKAALAAGAAPMPNASAGGSNGTAAENATGDLVSKVTDVDPLKESPGLFQVIIKGRDHFYPDGKPMTTGGFDKKTAEEQASQIKSTLEQIFLREISVSNQYKSLIKTEADKKAFAEQWTKAKAPRLNEIVAQIQSGKINTPAGSECQFCIQADFLEGFKSYLIKQNELYNNSTDNGIRGEDKPTREKRLAADALKYVQSHLLTSGENEIKSVENLDKSSQLMFAQYVSRYSQPLVDGTATPTNPTNTDKTTPPANPRLAKFKEKVFEIVRAWLRVQSFISLFTGGFGLDTAILDQVVKALETILGSPLSDAEKTEARAWATQLAAEAPRPQPTTQPTTLPVNPYPYPYQPTMVPVMPHGHGFGGHHMKNRMMMVPAPGGYYYFVR